MAVDRERILIIRFSSMGDVLLTTPVARCLRKARPNAEIHFLTKAAYATLLVGNPNIDSVLLLRDSLWDTIKMLRAERYTAIIDLHKNLRSAIIKTALGIPAYSFNKLNWEKWLMVNFKVNRLPTVHVVQRYLHAAAGLGVVDDGLGLDLFLSSEDSVEIPEAHKSGFVAVVIGAQHATKRLPMEKLRQLCTDSPWPIALIGGREDFEIAKQIAENLGTKIWNTCGELSIRQSAYVIGQSRHIIAHDTGMMHVAAALQKPITSVWGNTIPAFGMYPYRTANISMEVAGLECRPCSKLGHQTCPKGHFRCMKDQSIAQILESVNT